jgi:diguanylate cyclase (GGDEF)-like protein
MMTAKPNHSARVLVVDDSRLLLELAQDALREVCQVTCCESSEAALECLDEANYELIVSDLQLPGMSGLELLERVRRMHAGTEFVVATAHASVDSAVEALRRGAADYLQKPISGAQLAAVVERILSRKKLVAENERLRGTVRTLDSCRTLLHCLDPEEVYAVALDLLLREAERTRGLALFTRASLPGSDGVAFRGFDDAAANRLREQLVEHKPIEPDTGPREIAVHRTSAFHEAVCEVDSDPGPALAVPLSGGDAGECGVIWIYEDGQAIDPSRLDQIRIIADAAELALVNAGRFHRAKERAFIDDVTEVYNARYLLQATEHEIRRAERYGKPLSVLFLDLDHFKRVNDQYGHLVGSQVLRRLSEVLQECIRGVDTLARYGGDEFTILLEDTPHQGGLAVAERIRSTVANTIFEGGRGVPVRLTISIGVGTYPEHGTERDRLLDHADKAMYRAKSIGRDAVCSASDLDAE